MENTENTKNTDTKTEAQAELLFNRLRKRQKHLEKWAARTGAGAYRLYDRDIPEIPLVLDFYRNDRLKAVSGALYKRPYEKDLNEEERWICSMADAASRALEIERQNIFIKIRRPQRRRIPASEKPEKEFDKKYHIDKKYQLDKENQIDKKSTQYQKESNENFEMTIKENGLDFIVNLSDYIDTGLFPDLRLLRKMVMDGARDKTVLNLFCYTGSFSVYAAKGGARSVDSVDMSSTYLKRAARNAALNGVKISPERADVFRFLERAAQDGRRWDIIIADPPAFSNSKKMAGNPLGGVFDINRDYRFLISKCLPLLKAEGRLFFCVNVRKFRVQDFNSCGLFDNLKTGKDAGGIEKNILVKDITESVRDEDFRKKRMPLCCLLTKQF
ncbi:MAG: class I SAM-dependent methyltransferase [Spirochaetaceae bacterium]|jgi:23S rRNA G2069 N7-methylase RlmK/C1962 C5-methylase RlmI|nr:class I SAM-dependent methyltransferase [Spirochaetaceae bacterium]